MQMRLAIPTLPILPNLWRGFQTLPQQTAQHT
jgi:hypothetical protein